MLLLFIPLCSLSAPALLSVLDLTPPGASPTATVRSVPPTPFHLHISFSIRGVVVVDISVFIFAVRKWVTTIRQERERRLRYVPCCERLLLLL